MLTHTKAIDAVDKLGQLPVGWDFGSSGPAPRAARAAAKHALWAFHSSGAQGFDIVPGTDDSITIFAYRNDESIETQAFSNGKFDFLFEREGFVGNLLSDLTISDLAYHLEIYGWKSPRFYVSCTHQGMLKKSGGSLDQHSKIPAMAVVSQSYQPDAWQVKGVKFANTLEHFMKNEFQDRRQSIGESQPAFSQMATA